MKRFNSVVGKLSIPDKRHNSIKNPVSFKTACSAALLYTETKLTPKLYFTNTSFVKECCVDSRILYIGDYPISNPISKTAYSNTYKDIANEFHKISMILFANRVANRYSHAARLSTLRDGFDVVHRDENTAVHLVFYKCRRLTSHTRIPFFKQRPYAPSYRTQKIRTNLLKLISRVK